MQVSSRGSARKALPPRCRSVANGIHQSCAAARSGPANKRAIRCGGQSRQVATSQSQCAIREGHMVLRQIARVRWRACYRVESWRSNIASWAVRWWQSDPETRQIAGPYGRKQSVVKRTDRRDEPWGKGACTGTTADTLWSSGRTPVLKAA
jgi:hypothetical protein